jgi:hypothetical protein
VTASVTATDKRGNSTTGPLTATSVDRCATTSNRVGEDPENL